MRISDWSSDVCSSDLRSEPMSDEDGRPVFSQEALEMRDKLVEQLCALPVVGSALDHIIGHFGTAAVAEAIGRASCRARVCQYVSISVVAVSLTQTKNNISVRHPDNKIATHNK